MTVNNMTRDSELEKLILSKLSSLKAMSIKLNDESHLHVGHAGVKERGGRHYHVLLTIDESDNKSHAANSFNNLSLLKQHQAIYNLLGDLVGKEIHALRISISRR